MRPCTIAIDGPAASGKSTLGHYLAERLSYLYLDTGVLYRAVTWAVVHHGVLVEDEAAVTRLAGEVSIQVSPPTVHDGRQYTVVVDGQDVTWELRTPDVEAAVSAVSAYPGVREVLTQRMREIGRAGRVVMVGRDIGTVVLPDADLKLYVVASAEERARRRHKELREKGTDLSYADVLEGIRRRDEIDSSRKAAPLKPASDAILFDNTYFSIEEMFRELDKLVDARGCCRDG